jgi:predicted MFS family arabinose efflux permease
VRGNSAGWGSLEVVGSLAAGLALGIGFVAVELRVRAPMLPMRLFRSRPFAAGNATTFFLLASLFGAVFFAAQFLQTALGYGPLDAGLRLLPWTAMLFFVAPVAGSLLNRLGERRLIVTGLSLQALGMAWIGLVADPSVAYGELVPAFVIAGASVSMALPAAQTAVMGAVAPAEAGKASGTFNTMRQLGGVFGIALLVAVFAGAGGYASPAAFVDGFGPAAGVSAGLAVIGAATGLALPRRRAVAAPSAATVAEAAS